MKIKRIEQFKYNNREYSKLEQIKTEIENNIGAIIDSSDVTLTPKQKLNLLACIIHNRKDLIRLLSVDVDVSELQDETKMINILNYNG